MNLQTTTDLIEELEGAIRESFETPYGERETEILCGALYKTHLLAAHTEPLTIEEARAFIDSLPGRAAEARHLLVLEDEHRGYIRNFREAFGRVRKGAKG